MLPIEIPVGEIARVMALNEAFSKATPNVTFYEVPNIGSSPLLWPELLQVQQAKQKYGITEAFAWRCEVQNNSDSNVVKLNIPLQVTYSSRTEKPYQAIIKVDTLPRGKRFFFYIVNDCPVEVQFLLPERGTAKLAGEQSIREFEFTSAANQSFSLGANHSNWLQTTCMDSIPEAELFDQDQQSIAAKHSAIPPRPDITGEILYARRPVFMAPYKGHEASMLLLKLRVTTRTVAAATIRRASLTVESNGRKYEGKTQPIEIEPVRFHYQFGRSREERPFDLIDRIEKEPLRYSIGTEGWLQFLVDGLPAAVGVADLHLTITDDLGGEHLISAKSLSID